MFRITDARVLGPGVKQFDIEAPRIARKQKPGQFVIIRLDETGERIPLTIKGSDPGRGTITIVVQAIGKTTTQLNDMTAGDAILDVVGPLGKESEIDFHGTVVVIGGGVGTAIALPTARAMRDAGNRVISILGARTKNLLILEDEVRAASDEVFVMTDDGSYGEKGLVTDKLKELMQSVVREAGVVLSRVDGEGLSRDRGGEDPSSSAGLSATDARPGVDFVLAIGPVPMMRAVADVTRGPGIKTVVSLNSIMVDGTGMCGGCRVVAGGKSQFACVDGPEFDAHDVDFQILSQRNAMYREQEKAAMQRYEERRCAHA